MVFTDVSIPIPTVGAAPDAVELAGYRPFLGRRDVSFCGPTPVGKAVDAALTDLQQRVGLTDIERDRVSVMSFVENWPSTALGFGGVGLRMITPARTVVLIHIDTDAYVFWDGQPAYSCRWPSLQQWFLDMGFFNTPTVTFAPEVLDDVVPLKRSARP